MSIEEHMTAMMGILDLASWSGKTSPEPSAATKEKTSKRSSRKSSGLQKQTLPMCLCLKKESGANQGYCWETDSALPGDFMTHSFGESPSVARESRLSQILEDSAHPKYYLSEKACRGILNRAAKRGKELPELLKKALMKQAGVRSDP